MSRDITVGQYLPGRSIMHRLDPRLKIVITFLFMILVFLSRSRSSLAALVLLFIGLIICAGLSPLRVLHAVRPMLPVILFSAFINIFYVSGPVLFHFYFIHISTAGLQVGISLAIRLTILIAGSSLITYTTSLNAITAGMEQLLSPLKKIHLPVGELAMVMMITLRFLPTLAEEIDRIIEAQKARGADIGTGGIVKRLRSYFPIILPLFMSAFRRAFELTNAIECRCYHGDEGRTKLFRLQLRPLDSLFLFLFLTAFLLILLFNFWA
ncbi:MAG: energy-coupling factor transporter transmembrane component T [Sporolactobacillus sp.]